jgi:hypothetical protein
MMIESHNQHGFEARDVANPSFPRNLADDAGVHDFGVVGQQEGLAQDDGERAVASEGE